MSDSVKSLHVRLLYPISLRSFYHSRLSSCSCFRLPPPASTHVKVQTLTSGKVVNTTSGEPLYVALTARAKTLQQSNCWRGMGGGKEEDQKEEKTSSEMLLAAEFVPDEAFEKLHLEDNCETSLLRRPGHGVGDPRAGTEGDERGAVMASNGGSIGTTDTVMSPGGKRKHIGDGAEAAGVNGYYDHISDVASRPTGVHQEQSIDHALAAQQKVQMDHRRTKRLAKSTRYTIQTKSDVDIVDDGYKWRKYGQKSVKNSAHPRNYYCCTTPSCPARKRVERCTENPHNVLTTYDGTHNHPKSSGAICTTHSGESNIMVQMVMKISATS